MDPRFKGKLGYAVAADAFGQLEKAAVGNVIEQVFYAQSYFPRVPCYRLYNKVLLFICATLFLQLPMEVLQDHKIEENRLDDHQEDKSLEAEEHVRNIGIDYLKLIHFRSKVAYTVNKKNVSLHVTRSVPRSQH